MLYRIIWIYIFYQRLTGCVPLSDRPEFSPAIAFGGRMTKYKFKMQPENK